MQNLDEGLMGLDCCDMDNRVALVRAQEQDSAVVGHRKIGSETHNEGVSNESVGVVGDLNVGHEKTGGVGVRVSIHAKIEHNFLVVIIHGVERERLGLRQPGALKVRALVEVKHGADCEKTQKHAVTRSARKVVGRKQIERF
jgi:hypothetical protein